MKTFGDYLGNSFVLGHVADVGYSHSYNREFKKTTTAMATGTSLNKRFNKQNNGCARASYISLRPLQNYNVKSLNQLCFV